MCACAGIHWGEETKAAPPVAAAADADKTGTGSSVADAAAGGDESTGLLSGVAKPPRPSALTLLKAFWTEDFWQVGRGMAGSIDRH
jgi:hypothetical protein